MARNPIDRRRALGAIAAAVTTPAWAAPVPKKKADEPILITIRDDGKVVTVPKGREVVVELVGERKQTGWEINWFEGTSLVPVTVGGTIGKVEVPAAEFEPPAKSADRDEADVAVGTYRFRLKAQQPGNTLLHFHYIYPGGAVPPARIGTRTLARFEVEIRVSE